MILGCAYLHRPPDGIQKMVDRLPLQINSKVKIMLNPSMNMSIAPRTEYVVHARNNENMDIKQRIKLLDIELLKYILEVHS
jgi:hypothetical protein